MKKILVIFLIMPLMLFCSFKKKQKPYVLLSTGTISVESTKRIENVFLPKQRINYILVAPEGFKKPGVRVQISKQDEKTSNWGHSIIQSEDIYIDLSQKAYRDYVVVRTPGKYAIQFFYLSNKDYPFARREFWVQ